MLYHSFTVSLYCLCSVMRCFISSLVIINHVTNNIWCDAAPLCSSGAVRGPEQWVCKLVHNKGTGGYSKQAKRCCFKLTSNCISLIEMGNVFYASARHSFYHCISYTAISSCSQQIDCFCSCQGSSDVLRSNLTYLPRSTLHDEYNGMETMLHLSQLQWLGFNYSDRNNMTAIHQYASYISDR